MRMSEKQGEQQHIRVVVVDDHQVVREGLRMMLEILGEGFVLVGEAADGAASIRAVAETQPDVVLMDLRMPGMDGLEDPMSWHACSRTPRRNRPDRAKSLPEESSLPNANEKSWQQWREANAARRSLCNSASACALSEPT